MYPIPKALQYIEPGTVVLLFKGLMDKEMLALRLHSSLTFFSLPHVFFSSRENDLLISTIHNKQTRTDKSTKHKQRAPRTRFPPGKKTLPVHPFSKAVAPLLSTGVELLIFFTACLFVFGFVAHLQKYGV